ncbi:hypothetical protein [Nocardia sp. NPDC051570]|uniref:hypothetical protein n=1 Tax=Nocardia sp. NPDC051570 TaxID=3364324 RepID=UPI00379347BE
MPDTCVIDTQAVLRFGSVARQAFRDLDRVAARSVETIALIAESIPDSETVPAWCETACALANLVQRGADRFGLLAEHIDRTVAAFGWSDRAAAAQLDRPAVRI